MNAPDDAVRSIQVASALVHRLAELVKRPNPVGSAALNLLSVEARNDSIRLRLGEAQQVTPQIWSHLDDARNVLAARGLDVSSYNEIRAAQDPAMLATRLITLSRDLDRLGLTQGQLGVTVSLTVKWDSRVILLALAASNALKDLLPDIDFAALDRADHEQIAAVGSLKSARWKGVGTWIIVAVLLGGAAVGAGVLASRSGNSTDTTVNPHAPTAADRASALKKETAKLVELQNKYAANPCDTQTVKSLTAYLFALGRETESHQLEDKWRAECPEAKPAVPD